MTSSPIEPKITEAIGDAIAYLVSTQRRDGGFDSFSSPSAGRFKKVFTYQTTFIPALILTSLASIQAPAAKRLKRQLAGFIKNQTSPHGSFNYWSKASPERARQPYPDDLDDTACALASLILHDESLVGPKDLVAFVKLLLATEARVGGPYRTWLVPADSPRVWQDIDLAVNANIAYLLSLVSEPLANVTDHIETAIREEHLTSPYYVSTYPLIYYLSRAYDGPMASRLRDIAQQLRVQDGKLTPMKNALLLISLLRLGARDTASLARNLVDSQRTDGSWPAEAFCLDPARDGMTYYNGCESLTTALAVEALSLYEQVSKQDKSGISSLSAKQDYPSYREPVLASARQDCYRLGHTLRENTISFMEKLAYSSIGTEITDLPIAFNRSLKKPLGKAYEPLFKRLGLANLYGWAAYTIFDDFIDEEGQPELLPVAALSLRYSVSGFATALPEDSDFQDLVKRTFDTIDSANAWELDNCRCHIRGQQLVVSDLPDRGNLAKLAERSMGHCLAPLAVLLSGGMDVKNPEFGAARRALSHYLIARQINDDAHDWQTDLQNGHINYVVSCILTDAGVKPGSYSWSILLPQAQQQFWHHTLPKICRTIRKQTALSRHDLKRVSGLRQTNAITRLLDKIDSSVDETLAAQAQTRDFLKYYKNNEQAVNL